MAWRRAHLDKWLASTTRKDAEWAREDRVGLTHQEHVRLHRLAVRLPRDAREVMAGGMRTDAMR
eukprot:7063145-Alexandrium_andersonii.AAC.1